jgi:hypothetical protein
MNIRFEVFISAMKQKKNSWPPQQSATLRQQKGVPYLVEMRMLVNFLPPAFPFSPLSRTRNPLSLAMVSTRVSLPTFMQT